MMKHSFRRILALCLCVILFVSFNTDNSVYAGKKQYETFERTGNQVKDLLKYANSRVGKTDERGMMCAGFVVTCALAAGLDSSQMQISKKDSKIVRGASPFVGDHQFGFITKDGKLKYGCQAFTWKDVLDGTYTPQKGDLVFYGYFKDVNVGTAEKSIKGVAKKYSKNKTMHTHVGIVRSNDYVKTKTTYTIYTIDGGQKYTEKSYIKVLKKTRNIRVSDGRLYYDKDLKHNIYVMEIIRPNYKDISGPPVTAEDYMDRCTKTNTYLWLEATSSSDYIKSLPCSSGTFDLSENVRKMQLGETYITTAIYENTAKNYWYKVTADDGTSGYIYGGTAEPTGIPSDALTGSASIPTTKPKYGQSQPISGTLKVKSGLTIATVKGWLYDSTSKDNSDHRGYAKVININKASFEISGTAIDANLKFAKLAKGKGSIRIRVLIVGKYTDGKEIKTTGEYAFEPARFYFTVV